MFQSPGQVALSLGPLTIHWYGVIIACGILAAYFYTTRELLRQKLTTKHFETLFFYIVISGILGARLYYVIFSPSYFARNPFEILAIWNGGLAIHGAVIGGALALFIYVRKHKLNLFQYLDAIAPGLLLAQAIGRWGNFFNSEAFGTPTYLPWKLFIPLEKRPESLAGFEYFHPTFLYESLWNLLGVLILIKVARKTEHHGVVIFAYLIWYSFGRFFIEGLRTDSLMIGPIRIAQLISVVLLICSFIGLHFVYRRGRINHQ